MKTTVSIHATGQRIERGITEEGIMSILASSAAPTILSKTDPEAIIVLGKYEGKVWGVVFNFKTQNVITVRRAGKKERRFYEQKTSNLQG
jgi:uncharacterized DUF497 family protein